MRNTYKVLFAILIISLFIMRPASSYADWNGHNGNSHNGNGHAVNGHDRHDHDRGRSYIGVNLSIWPDSYYYNAPYYPYGDEVLVSPPVTIVEPPVVVYNQVQPAAPVITSADTTGDSAEAFTINIPNNKGGYTAVTLKRSGNGFVGPQGEFYPEFPKISHLKVIYGK